MRRFSFTTSLFILLCLTAVSVFGQTIEVLQPKPLNMPEILVPAEAGSGLAGAIRAQVAVDTATGNIIRVIGISGPGPICDGANSPNIAALRNAVSNAVLNARFDVTLFEGALVNEAVVWLNFFLHPAKTDTLTTTYPVRATGRTAEPDKYTRVGANEVSGEKNNEAPTYTVKGDQDFTASDGTAKQLSRGMLNGTAIKLPVPTYPAAARAVRASGTVTVQVVIDEDGNIFSAQAISGHPLLRVAARDAACGAEFLPTTLSGQPVRVSGVITYNFLP